MTPSSKITTITIITILSNLTTISSSDNQLTAYETLQSFNFPVGILPKGATGYTLDEITGKFQAYFNQTCSFSLEGSYQLSYNPTISGFITNNKLTHLTGVSVKVAFFWLNIVEVRRVGDNLEFSVGIASADFPIVNFYECPQCWCGLDCIESIVANIDSNDHDINKKVEVI